MLPPLPKMLSNPVIVTDRQTQKQFLVGIRKGVNAEGWMYAVEEGAWKALRRLTDEELQQMENLPRLQLIA